MSTVIGASGPVQELTAGDREQMFCLMDANYEGMDRQTFASDLDEKEAVLLIRDAASGCIVGFSTIMLLDLAVGSGSLKAVFSGDTIVAQEYRRTPALAVELGRYFQTLWQRFPGAPIYWILISKGCRTYRLLPFFFVSFYPCFERPTPPLYQEIRDAFGAKKYPQEYDPGSGLVRYRGDPQRLRPGVADATEARMLDPHTRFFVQANPHHMAGDDLVCVAEVAEHNLSKGFRRLLRNAGEWRPAGTA
jgi:hypothetical protein